MLDEATEVARMTLGPWAAVLVVALIPYRFLQAMFLDQLFEVGAEASEYGNLLGGTANLIVLSTLLALWGRAVFARACRLAEARGAAPGREAWRVRPAAYACYVLTATTAMLIGWIGVFTIVGFAAAVIFAGLAIGTMELNERVSVTRPFALIVRYASSIRVPVALVLVFFCALIVAMVNLAATFQLGAWLASAVGGFDAPRWQLLFTGGTRRFVLTLIAGALIVVEPFWIAANVVYVRKAGAEESGDDLRAWFDELRRAS